MAHNKLAEIEKELAALEAAEAQAASTMEAEPKEEAEVVEGAVSHAELDTQQEEEPAQLAELRAEAEKWKEKATKRDADVSMAFQDRAEFRKKLEERDAVIDDLKAKLEAISTQIENKKAVLVDADLDVDPEFESEFPDLSGYAKKVAASAASKALEKAAALEAKLNEINAIQAKRVAEDSLTSYRNAVESEHPDFEEFVSGRYSELIGVWANRPGKPKIVASIIQNPTAYDPSDLAYVLHQFKAENGIASGKKQAVAAKKPAPGDVAVSTGSKAKVDDPNTLKPFNNAELADIESLIRDNRRDPKKMAEIERRLELTFGGR